MSKLDSVASKFSTGLKTTLKVGATAIASVTAGVVALGKASIDSYAQLEQNLGGVETLFKENSKKVIDNANKAYKTAGLSANEYMSNVTSFSASLLQSVAGDTSKAADIADMAMIDMSDNANKMGTDMSAIQNAYQGFAKQNYTMLDNLKLGYGGTKTEMERLLKDAQKLTGVKYNINNLNDVYEAIHVIQGELGITGTTAKEAETTISGSIASLKASWDNFLNGSGTLSQVMENVTIVLKNIMKAVAKLMPDIINSIADAMPEMIKTGEEILSSLLTGITKYLPKLINNISSISNSIINIISESAPKVIPIMMQLMSNIAETLLQELPQILDCGLKIIVELIKGITQEVPTLIKMLPSIITQIVNTLMDNFPLILEAGIELIFALIDGIIDALPQLIEEMPRIIERIVITLAENLPKIVQAGIMLIIKLAEGLIQAIPDLVQAIPQIIWAIIEGIAVFFYDMRMAGVELMLQFKEGIISKTQEVVDACQQVTDKAKAVFVATTQGSWKWGSDMVQGLINGINSQKPSVRTATMGVAGAIKSLLHFSRPDEGPLMDYETWMPDMIQGLTKTLKSSTPILIDQATKMANQLRSAVGYSVSELSGNLTSGSIAEIQRNVEISANLSELNTDKEITVNAITNLDGKVLTQSVNRVNARQKLAYGY